jgi:aspartate/methionine/tyrosine aminotransferase
VTACADTFAQAVAQHIFETNSIQEHREWYHKQQAGVLEALHANGLQHLPIDGSFYACIQLPNGRTSLETSLALLEQVDVVAIPGIAFGPSFDRWLRLSWVAPLDQLREGIARITEFCKTS